MSADKEPAQQETWTDFDSKFYLDQLHGPEDRVGALSFGIEPQPSAQAHTFNRARLLANLREAARAFEEAGPEESVDRQLADLIEPGTSVAP